MPVPSQGHYGFHPDKQDISWETDDDKLVATVAEPTMSDTWSHFVFDSEELEDISKKL
jgi:hypothetical protein